MDYLIVAAIITEFYFGSKVIRWAWPCAKKAIIAAFRTISKSGIAMSNGPFHGSGFSRVPLEPDELAKHRQAISKLQDAWGTIEGVDRMAKGVIALRNVVIGAAVIGGAIAWAVKQGLFL